MLGLLHRWISWTPLIRTPSGEKLRRCPKNIYQWFVLVWYHTFPYEITTVGTNFSDLGSGDGASSAESSP